MQPVFVLQAARKSRPSACHRRVARLWHQAPVHTQSTGSRKLLPMVGCGNFFREGRLFRRKGVSHIGNRNRPAIYI